jgi:hypothetical protein
MKRLVLIMTLLTLTMSILFSASISTVTAHQVAKNFVLERLGSDFTVSGMMPLESGYGTSYLYVGAIQPQGYVLIASDDAAYPIIGYSTMNNWNEYEIPEQLTYLLQNWSEQMHAIVSEKMQADLPTSIVWNKYKRDSESFVPNRNFRDVAPLITSTWGQGTYYNAQCPAGTPVGCVATSMSQIMRYWSFPTTGVGSHSYNHPVYGVQSADFGSTVYNWAAMPNAISSHNSAVATICRHTGVSVNMDYGPDGSGAYSTAVAPALISYFKYKSTAQLRNKSSYSESNWESILRGELDNARPMYYSGYSAGSGGHAWVLDGYQGTNHFHMNWGWYGYYNGYYYLSNLNPGTYNFTQGQDAVTGIEPSETLPYINEGFEGATFPPNGWDVTASSFTRSNTTPIAGSYSARYSATGNVNAKRLRTMLLSINADTQLNYKAKCGTTVRAEQILVRYSSDGSTWTTLATHTLGATATTFTVGFSGVTPGDYYVCFETYSTDTNNGRAKTFFIDDVTGPTIWVNPNPIAALNITSWNAGALAPGEAAFSGAIFELANVGRGTLTITSVTNLGLTEFKSDINTGIALVAGQSHAFGFSYEPLNFGTDNATFNIVTNGGTVSVSLSGQAIYSIFSDGFENYTDFTLSFPPWTQHDGDGYATYTIEGVTFPNQGYTGSYIIFNPSQTTPPVGSAEAHSGNKYAACFAGTSAPNNDWLISPAINFAGSPSISFWAKSYTDAYGLERFKVLYSTTGNAVANFTGNYLAGSATTYVSAPVEWTNYTYTLPPACANTTVHIAIQCVSNDAFIFFVDDFSASDNSTPVVPDYGAMAGYVYEFGTTNPIPNALVKIGSKQAYTNSSGYYQINNIVVGTYNVTASAPGMFYFSQSASVVIAVGATTIEDFGLTWSELAVNPTSISTSVYASQTDVVAFQISNPGGTANLQYDMFFTSSSTAERLNNQFTKRKPADSSPFTRPFSPIVYPQERAEGWMTYTDPADANYYTYPVPERATKFYIEEFGMFAQGVTISQVRHYFYENVAGGVSWNGNNTYTIKIYDADGSTVLHTSPTLTAVNWPTANNYTLETPLQVSGDFWISVRPNDQTNGAPFSIGTDASIGNSWAGGPGTWEMLTLDLILMAYIEGNEWVEASQYSGSVTPGLTQNINIYFDSAGLPAGTKNAYLHIYNNSNYIAPSGSRGDAMIVPVSFEILTPTEPTATLNKTSWTTVATTGTPSSSGDTFQLKNVGMGTLTITSISGLSGTPFTSSFNESITLEANETHNFGFEFSPVTNGIFEATFEIVTNGGTKTIGLKGYGNYLFEDFEGGFFPPDGWQIVDNDEDTYNWFSYINNPHNGTQCAASASWISDTREQNKKTNSRGALTPDNWLISPRLTIATGDELNYWVGAQDPDWPAEYYSVKLSTTDSNLASFTETLFSETLTDGLWYNRIIDLSAYDGEEVFIAFQHHNCTDQFILKLDDILLPPLAAPLVYGDINGTVYRYGTTTPIENAVINIAGKTDTTGINGAYSILTIAAGTYQLTATATGFIAYQTEVVIPENDALTHDVYMHWAEVYTADVNFNTTVNVGGTTSIPVDMTNVGSSLLEYETASGIYGGDVHPSGYLTEDFEDIDITGWTGLQGTNTGIYGGGYGYNGSTYVWGFNSDQVYEPQYLITPLLTVETGDALTFWYKQFNASSEELFVLVSTTDNQIASFTDTLAELGPLGDTSWYNFNESLNAYAGMDIYICFYYPRVDGYQYGYVLIDDITGPQMLIPPTGWLSCTPILDDLAGGLSETLYLNIDATTLLAGTYTAQTWIFSNGIVSPYKLYVSVEVTEVLDPAVPENVTINRIAGGISLGWSVADNANSYKIYGATSPTGTFNPLGTFGTNAAQFTDAELVAFGLTNRAFFRVTSDTTVRTQSILRAKKNVTGYSMDRMFGRENLKFKTLTPNTLK